MAKFAVINVSREILSFDFSFHVAVIDGVVIYPREDRCAKIGGMCVESDKCKSLVSAKGLCPNRQHLGVECCFERESMMMIQTVA